MVRRIARLAAALFICWLLLTPFSYQAWQYPPKLPDDRAYVYLVDHGWHSGLVIPAKVINNELTEVVNYFNRSAFYEFGWGDSGFYQADEYTAALVARAIFLPSPSVMHVVAVPTNPMRYFAYSQITAVPLSSEALGQLEKAIAASFKRTANQRLVKLQPGLYGDSLFFEGHGSYHGLNTCNTWTGQMLKRAGVPMGGGRHLFSPSVTASVLDALQMR